MLATVSIRKNGYGMRFTFADFYNRYNSFVNLKMYSLTFNRYRVLTKSSNVPKNTKNDSARCDALCKFIKFEPNHMQKGKTKIFLKDSQVCNIYFIIILFSLTISFQQYNKLEVERVKVLQTKCILIQKTWRMFRARKRFRLARLGVLAIQSCMLFLLLCWYLKLIDL